jgi:hypothetical protein
VDRPRGGLRRRAAEQPGAPAARVAGRHPRAAGGRPRAVRGGSRVRGAGRDPGRDRPWPADLPPLNVLGVMSGTSVDGMDAVLARFERRGGMLRWSVVDRADHRASTMPAVPAAAAIEPGGADVVELTQLHAEVGEAYADLCAGRRGARTRRPDRALRADGLPHPAARARPRLAQPISTLQVGEPSRVLERCGLPVVSDFRQSDLAAGGQGAPMVPFGDLHLFGAPGRRAGGAQPRRHRQRHLLPPDGDPDRVRAFDTGPANCLLDEAVAPPRPACRSTRAAFGGRRRGRRGAARAPARAPVPAAGAPQDDRPRGVHLREMLPEGVRVVPRTCSRR